MALHSGSWSPYASQKRVSDCRGCSLSPAVWPALWALWPNWQHRQVRPARWQTFLKQMPDEADTQSGPDTPFGSPRYNSACLNAKAARFFKNAGRLISWI